ncbi:hypothetical protein GGTG_12801 [Gaeumannomyces tritici R3-111a-1]|uniref:Protein kinase domain-containing protein n=1 Tax=Gaeumannomyces tritici (strain R3-111a-1) TaxID=644352 RepID=J3PH21_GAET3|nr:hypothetical protein GGTG_12801 [Gaeumannomyces tritici R3-111a-1]EJT69918.1 hypothetical protein GGTG_12801 [Gaeumannomyces tritici R3-111a-1]
MEGYFPASVAPVQRRLSRLYNDTKKSSDFLKEPVHNGDDPDIRALHRKLRIQKDRLVSWGLEWSDNTAVESAELLIDTSLSKAGLSEVVGSIMSTIKDILAEAEPLWQSSRRLIGERDSSKEKGSSASAQGKQLPMVPWDKGRFEDLVRDLTTSIDTLYDLSRTRSSGPGSRADQQKAAGAADEMRAFESSRLETARQIDPRTLTNLRSIQAEPMSEEAVSGEQRPRDIVFMNKQAYADVAAPQAGSAAQGRQPNAPLLLEYANFDPIYSDAGIMPSMTRFERLSAGLQTDSQRSTGAWIGLPRLLAYFEDMEHSRLGLVYQFPPTFNPVSFENLTQNPLYSLCSLSELLRRPDFEPKLEAKFRLASNLANTVFDMHARGITHGNLIDTNISFCNAVGNDPAMNTADVDIRRPLVSSFDLFPGSPFEDPAAAAAPAPPAAGFSLYRHPLDPRLTGQASDGAESRVFDLYSLSMLLLSIGLWTNLENLVPHAGSTEIPVGLLDQLAIRCGTLYMKAVQACWTAVEKELSGQSGGDQLLSRVQVKASRYLEACCILDGVSGLEERLSDDLGEPRPPPVAVPPQQFAGGSSKESTKSAKAPVLQVIPERQGPPPPGFTQTTPVVIETFPLPGEIQAKARKSAAKSRLYPHVPLPADAVERWNKHIMPQVNQALRHFNRKHPESVEISLESIGASARETKPTVLVVCTSVSKVRSILKKQLGTLFDDPTGFALKVCRGQVLRSRKTAAVAGAKEHHHGGSLEPANGDFQEQPGNGASIGAWIGDRHLPPVSFGGVVLVDDKPYGMTVHHMLDDPDGGVDENTATEKQIQKILRSSATAQEMMDLNASLSQWYADLQAEQSTGYSSSSGNESDYACEFSDSESDAYSDSAFTSEDDDENNNEDEDDDDDTPSEPGDIPGVEVGCGDGYVVTQPALDDVKDGFFPDPDTADDEHLASHAIGEVHASSGIRRRTDDNGLVHEIDWALIEFDEEGRRNRIPSRNLIPRLSPDDGEAPAAATGDLQPITVAPASALPGLEVQCMARTSGLQSGRVLPALVSIKIYGRQTPSHSYQVAGTPSLQQLKQQQQQQQQRQRQDRPPLPLGVPGDSGAWIVEREHGRLCGHVLAWSDKKRVAYLCPMDVLLLDIAETLGAEDVRLPGGSAVVRAMDAEERRLRKVSKASSFSVSTEAQPAVPQPQPALQPLQHDSARLSSSLVGRWDSLKKRASRSDEGFVDDDVSSISTVDNMNLYPQ